MTSRIPVPILSGINRGRLWSLASAGSGYVLGTRAARQMDAFSALLRSGDVVWDIGAHHGFVSLAAARMVGPQGSVHAFEPSAENAGYLRRHLRWNSASSITVHELALGALDGTAVFGGGTTSKMHAVGAGTERVSMRRCDTLVAEGYAPPPDVIKIDVEGGELAVLESLLPVLPAAVRGTIAVHSRAMAESILARLNATHFTVLPSQAFAQMFRSEGWRGDPDLFLFGPASDPERLVRRALTDLGVLAT